MNWFKSKTPPTYELDPSSYMDDVAINLTHYPNIQRQLQLLELTIEDLAIIKQLQPELTEVVPIMVDRFYDGVSQNIDLVNIIQQHSKIERLKVTLRKHINGIFDAMIDEAYIKDRQRIASAHVRIGLESKWYLGSFQSLITTFIDLIDELNLSKEDSNRAIKAFTKIINLEQQLVIEAYEEQEIAARERVNEIKLGIVSTIQSTAQELNAISQETTAALHEISSDANDIAGATQQGLELVDETEQKSQHGREDLQQQNELMQVILTSVNDLDVTMEKLRDSSNKISEIVGLVTSIADQTNLLALNASIEAARAGEHGKGFAVVADEVRKLAEETKKAVQNVSHLITDTEINIVSMAKSVTTVDEQIHVSVDTQQKLSASFSAIAEAVSGIQAQYISTSEDISKISHLIQDLSQGASLVSTSSDALIEVVSQLDKDQ
ncbi:heme-based aerotactic transducer HemAT [Lysinibacillus alkalisoli]|uniref:Heme-based aerotactic transducer HemAT n=2 Tax=Lysinibacillus alkalisoli TaxID=1911548 RepID=A0A917G8R9_9BACI|nr:globin-coupled sensor protein [Lysinibacillus alkalisoli]GGG28896.1 heme-based aerotactic transducer HemAT [Lysinibacillus alkalisoli]